MCGKCAPLCEPHVFPSPLTPFFPFPALIAPASGTSYYQFCGASLVSPSHVLTASHCVDSSSPTNAQGIIVAIGRYNLGNVTEHGELITVKAVYQHPEYNEDTMFGDVCMLELPGPVTHPYIQPVRLVDEVQYATLEHGVDITVAGWGALASSGRRAAEGEDSDAAVAAKPTPYLPVRTPDPNASSRILAVCNVPNPSYIGDGYCDLGEYNTPSCNYDGGDCCKDSCDCANECYVQCGANGYDCVNPEFGGGFENVCNVDEGVLGDGYCDSGEANTQVSLQRRRAGDERAMSGRAASVCGRPPPSSFVHTDVWRDSCAGGTAATVARRRASPAA